MLLFALSSAGFIEQKSRFSIWNVLERRDKIGKISDMKNTAATNLSRVASPRAVASAI